MALTTSTDIAGDPLTKEHPMTEVAIAARLRVWH